MTQDKILILDFGSQVAQLIARRVREAHVYCELHPYDMSLSDIKDFNPKGIILSGGPNSVYNSDYQADTGIFELGIPILGICYGMQFMAHHLGGAVSAGNQREFGYAQVQTLDGDLTLGIYDNAPNTLEVWMSHGDKVSKLPTDFHVIGQTANCPIAIMENTTKHFYGIQFHPEVTHTKQGRALLNRFVLDICGAKANWTMPHYIDEAITKIREQVGDEEVILGLSGGVDSSVAAALIHRAIGKQLTCVFVDHGLLRLNEANNVMHMFTQNLGVNVIHIDASQEFLSKLAGITDPEQKRKIIGAEFVTVFQREASKLNNARWLAQGTIYPDVIESAGTKNNKAHAIKSHHNVGGLPETLNLKLLEPLRDLFKDEVRELGIALGLPHEMVYRHPFPGPGLGVRILGEIKAEYADLLRRADAIFIEELHNHTNENNISWYNLTSQAFAVFLPVKSVGVMGDGRTYDFVVALRAVITSDFMTAHWAELPYTLLSKVSNRIINEVHGINRVVYDISGKPPATIEWE